MTTYSLYAISSELKPLEEALEAVGGEETEDNKALVARVESLQLMTQAKVDMYGAYYRNLTALAKAVDDEAKRLLARRDAILAKVHRLKSAAKESMAIRNIVKVEGTKFTISLEKDGGLPPVILKVPAESLPDKFVKVIKEADIAVIRKALQSGSQEAQEIAELGERGEHVRIR